MAHVFYGMLVSLDGYISSGQPDLQLPVPGEALHRWFTNQLRDTKLSIYGRDMYEVMRYWGDPDPQRTQPWDVEFAEAWSAVPKIVVSTTLKEVGPNATLISSDIEATLRRIKAETDGLVDVSGARMAASLGRWGLLDEYQMFVQPTVFGGGKPYFAEGYRPDLKLIGTTELPERVIQMRYAPVKK